MSVTGSNSDYSSSCKPSNMSTSSYSSSGNNEQNALQSTSLQQSSVGIKHFIPCVDIQVRKIMRYYLYYSCGFDISAIGIYMLIRWLYYAI